MFCLLIRCFLCNHSNAEAVQKLSIFLFFLLIDNKSNESSGTLKNCHSPTTTAPIVNSTKAFFLRKLFTSSLLMSSTFFLALRERRWMLSRMRCTWLRERGFFSPVLLVMTPQGLQTGGKASAVAGLAGDRLQVSVSGNRDPSPLWRFNRVFSAAAAAQFRPPRSLLFT